jgi:UDP-2,3-diacylglucosamine pyrophosphatase LpxH
MKKLTLILLSCAFVYLAGCKKSSNDTNSTSKTTFKIAVLSDIHVMDHSLLVQDGPAFQAYLKQDRKLLAESDDIFNEAISELIASKPDLVLISGDLTKDGEAVSHHTVANMLTSLMNAGIKVRVICGNHDISNPFAVQYNGSTTTPVPNISQADFKSIYYNFGYSDAIYTDPNSLSYITEPLPNLWLFCIDDCEYYGNNDSTDVTAGTIKSQTMAWLMTHLTEAKQKGKTIIGMEHHGVIEHFTGQSLYFSEYVLQHWQTTSDSLMNAGLNIIFTGHFHANDITKKTSGSKFLYDIETGSTVTYPCPYRMITYYKDSAFSITTNHITNCNYNTNGIPFTTWAQNSLQVGMDTLSKLTLMGAPYYAPQSLALLFAPRMRNAMMAHYAGDENLSAAEDTLIVHTIPLGGPLGPILQQYIMTLWTDLPPHDNTLFIDLKSGNSH